MIKISVTKYTIYSKNYIIFTNVEEKVCNKFFIFNSLKNKEKEVYSTFETVTVILSLLLSTVHSIISPALISIICAIGAGNVVRTELLLVVPLLIFVFCLNIIIPPCLYLVIIISITLGIKIFSFKNINKKVTFIYYYNLKY